MKWSSLSIKTKFNYLKDLQSQVILKCCSTRYGGSSKQRRNNSGTEKGSPLTSIASRASLCSHFVLKDLKLEIEM